MKDIWSMGLVEITLIVDFLIEPVIEFLVYLKCLVVDKIWAYPIYLFVFVVK